MGFVFFLLLVAERDSRYVEDKSDQIQVLRATLVTFSLPNSNALKCKSVQYPLLVKQMESSCDRVCVCCKNVPKLGRGSLKGVPCQEPNQHVPYRNGFQRDVRPPQGVI